MPKRSPAPQKSKSRTQTTKKPSRRLSSAHFFSGVFGAFGCITLLMFGTFLYLDFFSVEYHADAEGLLPVAIVSNDTPPLPEPVPVLDEEAYDAKMLQLALGTTTPQFAVVPIASSTNPTATTTARILKTKDGLWPVDAAYPKAGALVPFNRIIAYYGNFYSTRMGALGEYPADEMLARLQAEVDAWEVADPTTPVVPAIHYIATTAQASAGEDGLYRLRMPSDQIEHAIDLAERIDGIVFLDIQIGFSDLMSEIRRLEPWLKLPNVHLGIDPEFAMRSGHKPGTMIGTVDAADMNAAAEYLATLVREHDLPPKILVIHRFTYKMVTNTSEITPLPEVQFVMHMDGWGEPAKKFGTYNRVVAPEPVQFTGFKVFYKNDLKPPSTHILTPEELLTLRPQPIYIQYQ